MRAALVEKLVASGSLMVIDERDTVHHLLNVARIKQGQLLKLLDGKGSVGLAKVEKITKKSVDVFVEKVERGEKETDFHVAVAYPKKDALESCLRSCVEIGASKIILLKSERSQSVKPNLERYHKIIKAGLEQSNNPFYPEIEILDIKELDLSSYDFAALATLKNKKPINQIRGKGLLIIGPEGGFTEDEEEKLLKSEKCFGIRFKGPILRTQNAIPFFAGFLCAGSIEA